MTHQQVSNLSEVLVSRDNVGSVSRCSAGCLHIATGHVVVRFTEKEFWQFMELISEAATGVIRTSHSKRSRVSKVAALRKSVT